MSTITRIKGVIDNPNLPVISPEGLVNPIYGKYINYLAEQDYTLTTVQANAVKAFIQTITDNGLADYIISMFPLIGSSDSVNGAKVPIFGDKLLDFDNTFDGFDFVNGYILGINKMPSVPSLKLSDVVPDSHFIGFGYSLNKKASSEVAPAMNKFVNFNNKLQVRLQPTEIGYTHYFYYKAVGSDAEALRRMNINNADVQNALQNSGAVYGAIIGSNVGYTRFIEKDGLINVAAESTFSGAPDFTAAALDSSLSYSAETPNVNQITSMTFFKKWMTGEQITVYMDAVKTLMTALGRNV